MLKVKGIYERAEKADGLRILVDRLWPRRLSKSEAKIDKWMKEVSPSSEWRRWFAHREKRLRCYMAQRMKREIMLLRYQSFLRDDELDMPSPD